MTIEKLKEMLDACYQAKRIRDMLPALPKDVLPSYVHFLDIIETMESQGIAVKVSNISDVLKLPRPGVSRTVKEMEEKGYLIKTASAEDGRITYLTLTRKGKELSEKYNQKYFSALAGCMDEISEEDANTMIRTIDTFYQIMCERKIKIDE